MPGYTRLPLTVTGVRLEVVPIDVTQPGERDRVLVPGPKMAYISAAGIDGEFVGRGDDLYVALGRALTQALGKDGQR